MILIEPWHWLLLGAVLVISEIFLTTFASLWFGIAAIVVAIILWLAPISIVMQLLIWLILSIVMVVAWFKYIKPLAVDRTKAGLGGTVIVGEIGMIIVNPLPERSGTVRFSVPIVGATEWMCRTKDDEIVEVGDRVMVVAVSGNELIISPLNVKESIVR